MCHSLKPKDDEEQEETTSREHITATSRAPHIAPISTAADPGSTLGVLAALLNQVMSGTTCRGGIPLSLLISCIVCAGSTTVCAQHDVNCQKSTASMIIWDDMIKICTDLQIALDTDRVFVCRRMLL